MKNSCSARVGPEKNGQSIFLSSNALSQTLTDIEAEVLVHMPEGIKQNVYCVMNNKENSEQRKEGKRCTFADDCSAWSSAKQPSVKTTRRITNGHPEYVLEDEGTIYYDQQKDLKRSRIPVVPQPPEEELIRLNRKYWYFDANNNFLKRAIWIDGEHDYPKVTVVQYMGDWSPAAPNENCRKQLQP